LFADNPAGNFAAIGDEEGMDHCSLSACRITSLQTIMTKIKTMQTAEKAIADKTYMGTIENMLNLLLIM
jgi:hypothetical protein